MVNVEIRYCIQITVQKNYFCILSGFGLLAFLRCLSAWLLCHSVLHLNGQTRLNTPLNGQTNRLLLLSHLCEWQTLRERKEKRLSIIRSENVAVFLCDGVPWYKSLKNDVTIWCPGTTHVKKVLFFWKHKASCLEQHEWIVKTCCYRFYDFHHFHSVFLNTSSNLTASNVSCLLLYFGFHYP